MPLPKVPDDARTRNERESKKNVSRFKYSQALKQLIPIRPSPKKKDVLPTHYAGFFSSVSNNWLTPLMWKAYKNELQEEDIWTMPPEESSRVNCARMERLWDEECQSANGSNRKPRLWKAVWRFMRTRVIIAQCLTLLKDITFFLGPMVYLPLILDYINSAGIDYIYGIKLFFLKMVISNLLPNISHHMVFLLGTQNGSRLTCALQALLYKKTLTLRTGGENLSAQVINISSNDMERIYEVCVLGIFLLEVLFIFLVNFIFCVYLFGWWSALGFGVYLLFYPAMGLIARLQSNIREKTIRETDRRVGLMSEILNSVRLIKMYAWEEPFTKKIADIRKCEMKMHRIGALLSSITTTLMPSVGVLATIVSILSFTLSGNAVTSTQAFTLYNMFNMMGFTVTLLPYLVKCFAEANVSFNRMESILELPEHMPTSAGEDSETYAIQITKAYFAWEETTIDNDNKNVDNEDKNVDSDNKNVSIRQPTDRKQRNVSGAESKIEDDEGTSLVLEASSTKDFRESLSDSSTDLSLNHADKQAPSSRRKSFKTSVTLFKVNLKVPNGKLLGVCGSIGSGKSSLISAICGDMRIEQGKMYISGQVALVTQQAWIYSGTLRDNILLGKPYDEVKYKEAIRYCCLQSDLDILPAGDLTEIGDRGINLSGGQKQRVNLARAVYSNRDIYLLDDPLSAVDTKVANSVFNHCIKEYLKGKTVLLVTHALHLLEQCDEIVVMNDGRVSEQGTHSQLLANKGDYFLMVGGLANPTGESSKEGNEKTQDKAISNESDELPGEEGLGLDGKLTTEEGKESGGVSASVYRTFVKVCGGWCVALWCLIAVVLFVLLRIFNAVWLQIWLDEGDGLRAERQENVTTYNLTMTEDELKGSIIDNPLLWMYQTVYSTSFIVMIVFSISKGAGVAFSVLRGATQLHNGMFNSILRSPMTFFDKTPSGRILNRFSRDLDQLDTQIPYYLEFVVQGVLTVIGQAILVCTIYVWFTIPFVVMAALLIFIDIFLNAGVRELKRIDNMRKSPVIQHIGSSLAGLSVIRTFDQQDLFTERFYKYLDEHTVAQLVFRLSARWYVYRADMLAMLINNAVSGICIFTKGLVSTASAGLALSTTSDVCDFFPWMMKMKSEFQSRFTVVERLSEYAYDLESEAPWETTGKQPPGDWPEFGKVELKKVSLRYREDLPLVLHGIEATFEAGQKIGVVGRTGAGKSSLISTLLRLVELDSGCICIDDVDISTLGLHTLRSAISVIPQDPVLFQGTIRYNLDPFEEYSDASVWEALEQSNLKRVVTQQEKGLQSQVATAGENFSVGERQLICLTRALLRKSKILLLDEATASVDLETDQMIQTTIRKAFAQSTVITIAHRLNTITTYDKVLVLREGRLVEFDSPVGLMRKEGSLFREMMSAMGVFTVEQMRALV